MTWKPKSPLITADDAEQAIQAAAVVVIHVWAEWNPFDQNADKEIQSVREQFGDGIRFYAMDADGEANWNWMNNHGITTLPALICFVDGKVFETLIGFGSARQFRENIRQLIDVSKRHHQL